MAWRDGASRVRLRGSLPPRPSERNVECTAPDEGSDDPALRRSGAEHRKTNEPDHDRSEERRAGCQTVDEDAAVTAGVEEEGQQEEPEGQVERDAP
jgi:hypothetical protein